MRDASKIPSPSLLLQFVGIVEYKTDKKSELSFGTLRTDQAIAQLLQYNRALRKVQILQIGSHLHSTVQLDMWVELTSTLSAVEIRSHGRHHESHIFLLILGGTWGKNNMFSHFLNPKNLGLDKGSVSLSLFVAEILEIFVLRHIS